MADNKNEQITGLADSQSIANGRPNKSKILVDKYFGFIACFLIIMILIAGYVFVVADSYKEYLQTRYVQLVEMDEEIASLERGQVLFKKYISQMVEYSNGDKELLNLVLPPEFDFSSFIVQFSNLASAYDFEVDTVDVSEVKAGSGEVAETNGPQAVAVKATLIGKDYDAWKRFLSALEENIMIFDIKSVDMTTGGSSYQVDFVTYYYPDNK